MLELLSLLYCRAEVYFVGKYPCWKFKDETYSLGASSVRNGSPLKDYIYGGAKKVALFKESPDHSIQARNLQSRFHLHTTYWHCEDLVRCYAM